MKLYYWSFHPKQVNYRDMALIFNTKSAVIMGHRLKCFPNHDSIKLALNNQLNDVLRIPL